MLEQQTKKAFRERLKVNYLKSWGVIEFDPADTEINYWYQQGFRAGFCFDRNSLRWGMSEAAKVFKGVVDLYTQSFGDPVGPAEKRVWNRYISLADEETWVVVKNPTLITLALMTVDLREHV